MKYLELFLAFLKVGLVSFGGGYAGLPLIRETVLSHGWMSDDMFSYFVAVSESTPGPVMVNTATYVGSVQGGILGAVLATLGVVLPAFVIILLVSMAMKRFLANKSVQGVLTGLKPCIAGVILSTGIYMLIKCLTVEFSGFDFIALIICAAVMAAAFAYKKIRKKKMSSIIQIIIAAVLGAILYGI